MSDTKIEFLIPDLLKIIIDYVDGDIDVGIDFLDELNWECLSYNPSAVYILEKESKKSNSRICWDLLPTNRSHIAMQIVEQNLHKLDTGDNRWITLVLNPFAIDIIEGNLNKIDMYYLSGNTSNRALNIIDKQLKDISRFSMLCSNKTERAIEILKKNMCKIDWYRLSCNPYAIDIIENNVDTLMSQVDWEQLSSNTSSRAIKILENNLDKIHWGRISSNESAINLIERYVSNMESKQALLDTKYCRTTLYWFSVCQNPSAINFLEKIIDIQPCIIDWRALSMNKAAIHILEKNMDKVNWDGLSENSKAIHILEKNIDKIDYQNLSSNPTFFTEYPNIKLRHLLNID